MGILKKITVLIDGKETIGLRHLNLTQSIDTHNVLEVHFPMDLFDQRGEAESESKANLGSRMSISLTNLDDNGDELKFSGLITEISIERGENTETGNVIIYTAKSNDIISNDGPNYQSFEEKKLSDIVKTCCSDYGFKTKISPMCKDTLDYKVQHNESAYQFLHRIAREYGEWFYYNEDTVYFGKPSTEEVKLNFNEDLIELKTTLVPKSHDYSFFSNNYNEDKIFEDSKDSSLSKNTDAARVADKAGKDIFKNKKNVWLNVNSPDQTKKTLEARGESQRDAIVINQVNVSGVSINQNVSTGKIIDADGAKYRVIHVYHSLSYSGGYTNEFKAVAGDGDVSPLTNIHDFAKSGSQVAVIVENDDPDQMGRVRVQFAWHKNGEMTPWIRLVVPHAGKSQGIQFFPEVDDQVIVDFEGGNVDYPYVVGSVYHKNQKQASTEGGGKNNAKAIITKGGNKIVFNDENGKESITIVDKKGNTILIDAEKDDITITSLNNINLTSAKDIMISAGGKLKLTSGSDMVSESGSKISSKAALEINNESGTDYKIKAGTNAKIEAAIGVELKSNATAKIDSAMVDINGKGMTNIKGAIVNLN